MGQSVNLIEYIDSLIGDDYVSLSQLLEVQEAIEYINENGQNDTDENTLNGALLALAGLMETNLQAMGVYDADMSNGLMTLASRVFDIEPSVNGLNLSLSLNLSASKLLIKSNETFNLSANLSANYDDTTETNIDLSGVITNATILFKDENGVTIGSGVTDNNGDVTISNVSISDDCSFQAFFTGTSNFDSVESNTVTIEYSSFSLTANKNIIGQTQNETATLTITLGSDTTGYTVKWYKDSTLLDTTSFTNQESSYNYSANGSGDITIKAEVYNSNNEKVTEDTISIEDCIYWNDGTRNDLICASGTSVSIENGALKVTTSTSGEKKWYYPTRKFSSGENIELIFEYSGEASDKNGYNMIGFNFAQNTYSSSNGYAGYWVGENWNGTTNGDGSWNIVFSGTLNVNHTLFKGDIIRFTRENGYSKLYHNGELLRSESRSISYYMGGYTNQNRVFRAKNIKIKPIV